MRVPILAIALALALGAADAGLAQVTGEDIRPRRVKPPQPGQQRRITVQVTEEDMRRQRGETGAPASVARPASAGAASGGRIIGGFWGDRQRARGLPGLAVLPPAATRPASAATIRAIIDRFGGDIMRATEGTRVSPALVVAVIAVESSGRTDAVSPAGALGLMQLMPATAEAHGVADPGSAVQNILGGVRFLDHLVERFDGDPALVLAAYNAGETAVLRHGGIPPFAETLRYVPKVLATFALARTHCATPAVRITDRCDLTLAPRRG